MTKIFLILPILVALSAVAAVSAAQASSYDPCVSASIEETNRAMKEDPNFGGIAEIRALTRSEEYEVRYRFRDECTGSVIVQVKLANGGKTCSVISSDSNSYAYDCR